MASEGHIPRTILVVDDEAAIREMVSAMLERLGFGVLTAADAAEGLKIYRERADDIAVVLLDVSMPKISGEEAFREIRRIRSDARVLLASGFAEEEATTSLQDQGPTGFIQKPFRLETLGQKIREILGS